MPFTSQFESEIMKHEIGVSFERCRSYGINPLATLNIRQFQLSPKEFEDRMENNREFLSIAIAHIQEIYRFVAGAGFAACIVDRDGFILETIGDKTVLDSFALVNCTPGYRWTEKDVGTSAISLVIERQIPVQINGNDHFCKRGHCYACSASPVFDDENRLMGVISMTGEVEYVHPHTLGMVITAAKAIQNQLRITKTSRELLLRNKYMNAIIESIDSGVMAIDRDGHIAQINNQGRKILKRKKEIVGMSLALLLDSREDYKAIMDSESGFTDREVFISDPMRALHLMTTAKPILDTVGKVHGTIFLFHEMNRIRRLVNKMAGSQARFTFEDILGVSPAIQEAKKLAMLAAAGRSNVLLLGETGTGKELFAQSIHNQSSRKVWPLVTINCGAIPHELFESELFGYVEGAFTGAKKGGRPGKLELADGGTVFLDEIGDMPTAMQVKLLRVLQYGEVNRVGQHKPLSVDLRVIAAGHSDLKDQVDRGSFREDLFYRLNVLPIFIPPLRERMEDVPLLAKHILNRCREAMQKDVVRFSAAAEKMLLNYSWPGNIRELENMIERAVNLVDGTVIEPHHFVTLSSSSDSNPFVKDKKTRLEDLEKQAIIATVKGTGFNMASAARALGICRATLYKKVKKYNIPVSRRHV
jgi:sigma-54 dependent transcriptional regulator, acetoin dehydrogenase operon transcriptional activator AcoR